MVAAAYKPGADQDNLSYHLQVTFHDWVQEGTYTTATGSIPGGRYQTGACSFDSLDPASLVAVRTLIVGISGGRRGGAPAG